MKFDNEETRNEITSAVGEKTALLAKFDRYYNIHVLDTVVVVLERENSRLTTIDLLEAQHTSALTAWKQLRRFFREERGVWSSR